MENLYLNIQSSSSKQLKGEKDLPENEEQNKPFNDAMEHQQNVEGAPIPNTGELPLPIKVIGYFLIGGIILILVFGLVGNFLFN